MSTNLFSESAIFERIVLSCDPPLGEHAARSILGMGFSPDDQIRLNELAEKARLGTLTADESREIESFERVGHYLGIMKSKARQSLGIKPNL